MVGARRRVGLSVRYGGVAAGRDSQTIEYGARCLPGRVGKEGATLGKHWQNLAAVVDPAFVEMARSIAEIPASQLADGPERDYLIAQALAGRVEAYRPHMSQSYNLWFEEPVRERVPLSDWLLFYRLAH